MYETVDGPAEVEPVDIGARIRMLKGEFSTLALPEGNRPVVSKESVDSFMEKICSYTSPAMYQGFQEGMGKRTDISVYDQIRCTSQYF